MLKNNIKKIIAIGLGLFFTGFQAQAATPPVEVRFATEATYPPFEYMDEDGVIQGFDIDIAKAICQVEQLQCTFSNQAYNSLIPSIQMGKFDAAIAAMGVTPEREEQVNFTASYYVPSAVFIAPLSVHATLASVKGSIIGVQQGSTFESYLKAKYGNTVTLKKYASIQETYLDLIAGRVDMVLADTPIAKDWLSKSDHAKVFGIVEKPIIDHEYFGTGYAIAVNKNNADLLEQLNQGLKTIQKNGTYQKIYHAYFGR